MYGADDVQNAQDLVSKRGLLQVEIDQCIFERNYGINIAFGSALSIDGLQGHQYESSWKTPIGKAAKL